MSISLSRAPAYLLTEGTAVRLIVAGDEHLAVTTYAVADEINDTLEVGFSILPTGAPAIEGCADAPRFVPSAFYNW